MHVDTVRKWRRRFCQQRLAGLVDRPRSGRPATFPAVTVAQVKAMACELPAEHDLPLSQWSCPELAREAVARHITASISASTVRRWLAADALKPWQHRSWIFPHDPQFAVKAARVLDLYGRTWQGQPLGDDEYVISADEKSQLQALRAAGTRTCRAGRVGPAGRSSSTAAAAPWPTWWPTTCTTPTCWDGALRPPASSRSAPSRSRS